MTHQQLIIAQCQHQQATAPEDYVGFAEAYFRVYLQPEAYGILIPSSVINLAYMIDNRNLSYRTTPVRFRNGNTGINPASVSRAMQSYIDVYNDTRFDPIEAYREFQLIHPFEDGNGRVGHLLWANYARLLRSEWPMSLPPNVFGEFA